MAVLPKYGEVPRRRDDLLSVRVPRHVPDHLVRGVIRHMKNFSIKRQKIRDNDDGCHDVPEQVVRGLEKRDAKRQQSLEYTYSAVVRLKRKKPINFQSRDKTLDYT